MGSCHSKSVRVDSVASTEKNPPKTLNKSKMEVADEHFISFDPAQDKSVDEIEQGKDSEKDDAEKDDAASEGKPKQEDKKLTPEEIEDLAENTIAGLQAKMDKVREIENYDKADEDGHFPTTTRNLTIITYKSYFALKGAPLERLRSFRKTVCKFLIEIKVVDVMIEIYKYYTKLGWKSETEDGVKKDDKLKWTPFLNATLVLLNFSDASEEFGIYMACYDGFLETVRWELVDKKEVYLNGGQKEKAVKMTEYAISLSHNISMRDSTIQQFRDLDFTSAIQPYLQSPNEMARLNALATLASIIDEKESEIINANQETVKLLLSCLEKGMKSPLRRHSRWSCNESAFTVRMLARNDANKKLLSDLGAVEILVKVALTGDEEEKFECVNALWTLAFDPDIRQIMVEKEDIGLVELLQDIKNTCDSPAIKKACNGALWTMREELKTSGNSRYRELGLNQEGKSLETAQRKRKKFNGKQAPEKTELGHVMISYQWGDQKTLIKIRDRLKEHGVKVWMDIDQMAGSTLQAMADAVENASIILMAMSHKYKDSPNCRAEAEYAFQKRKKIIPLLMEGGYIADGWLGFILGAKLFYNFSGKYPFENKMEELLREITSVQQIMEGKEQDESLPHTSTPAVSSEPHQTSSAPQSSPLATRSNLVSMTTVSKVISKVRGWKPADVQNWINKNDLNGCGVSHLTGGEVALLIMMKVEAPEHFYKCLETMLRVNDLLTLSKIVWALTDLGQEG